MSVIGDLQLATGARVAEEEMVCTDLGHAWLKLSVQIKFSKSDSNPNGLSNIGRILEIPPSSTTVRAFSPHTGPLPLGEGEPHSAIGESRRGEGKETIE